jgi:hypothetical protein
MARPNLAADKCNSTGRAQSMRGVVDVLGRRVVVVMVVMRGCKRYGGSGERCENEDCEDFLQKIVHGADLMIVRLKMGS